MSELKCFGGEECEYGYIVPGHGLKGKQKVLVTNEDIISMYQDYKGKQIRLWVKRHRTQKRTHSPSPAPDGPSHKVRRSNYDSHPSKMSEVELTIEKLKENLENSYSPEQLWAWAHMIHMKCHTSYEFPQTNHFLGSYGVESQLMLLSHLESE